MKYIIALAASFPTPNTDFLILLDVCEKYRTATEIASEVQMPACIDLYLREKVSRETSH